MTSSDLAQDSRLTRLKQQPLQTKDAIIRFILESQKDYLLAQSRE